MKSCVCVNEDGGTALEASLSHPTRRGSLFVIRLRSLHLIYGELSWHPQKSPRQRFDKPTC